MYQFPESPFILHYGVANVNILTPETQAGTMYRQCNHSKQGLVYLYPCILVSLSWRQSL